MAEERQSRIVTNELTAPSVPRRMAASPPASLTMTPKEVFGILRRHIFLIVSLTISGLIVGGVSWYLLSKYAPKYTATALIEVLPQIERDPMTIGGGTVTKEVQYGFRSSIAALIKQQSSLQGLIARDKIQETKWFKSFGRIKEKSIAKAVKELKDHFGVSALRDGDFVVLSMTCGDKLEAALIVNEMVDLFLASQGGSKKEEIARKLTGLEDQRVRVQRDLDAAERAIDDVRRRWGFADLGEHDFQDTITIKLNDLEKEQSELNLEIVQLQSIIETLRKQALGPVNEQVSRQIESDPVMVMLAQQLASLESMLAGRLTKFGENHRVVRQTQELINATEKERQLRKVEIAEQTRVSNLQNAQDSLISLTDKLKELENLRQEAAAKKEDLDQARIQYEQRVSVRDERQDMLDSVKSQIEKFKMLHDDPESPKVQFVGYAPVPLEISSPRWEIFFPAGSILGLMFGIGLALLVEMANDLVRTPRDVGRYLHIPLLGVIPDADEDKKTHDVDLCHVVRQAPYSFVSESYRRFRTNLKLSDSTKTSSVLLVTSGAAGDGKTPVAVNLAAAIAAESKKVLLIDTNFWQPSLSTVFPKVEAGGNPVKQSDYGLSNLLMGQCDYQEVIRHSGVEGFDIIDSGTLPFNPAELIEGVRMEQLLKHQRGNYDYVIIDGPPVLLVSDTKMLARLVDGTILVFNAEATRRGAAIRTISELREVNAPIAGCVLFAVKAMKGGYFEEQFKSYQEYQKPRLAHSI